VAARQAVSRYYRQAQSGSKSTHGAARTFMLMHPPGATAMNRSPAAWGWVIARTCRSATSRTSETPIWIRGAPGSEPSSSLLTIPSDEA